jgi:general stress protein CsbA
MEATNVMPNFSHSNNPRQNHQSAVKHQSIIPGTVTALALAWFAIDLGFRLGGYKETYWMVDLDVVAVLVLIIGVVFLALKTRTQKAERTAAEYERLRRQNPRASRLPVSDGGNGLPTQPYDSDDDEVIKPGAYFDGGTFPTHK